MKTTATSHGQARIAQPKREAVTVLSALSPLREPVFRALWVATVASNLGSWMQDVGESWLMVSLTASPILIALVETAGSLPTVLLALPAGALADVFDRRRLLLITQMWMLVAAAVMGAATLAGFMTPWLLLLLTFTLGLGSAINSPAWQAIVPELVSASELPSALALSGVGFNVARAVGPALGGLLVAAAGSGFVFLLNALSFVGIIVVIYRWNRTPQKSTMPPEHIPGAMRAGVRYVRNAPELQAILIRSGVFIICASALWALLPLQTRLALGLGSLGYGLLLGCIGAGAIAGAGLLPSVRLKFSNDLLVIFASVVFAAMTIVLAHAHVAWFSALAMLLVGVAWITSMSCFNTAVQTVAPAWVRGRVLAIYTLVFMGGMAVGSAAWGAVAGRLGVARALDLAAAGLVIGLAFSWRYRLIRVDSLSLAPWVHWPEPIALIKPEMEHGPVLIHVGYQIDPAKAQEFRHAMRDLQRIRRRDGASRWHLYSDPSEPGRFIETFIVESWAEHLRQHGRGTEADRKTEERVFAFHLGEGAPVATHLISEHVPR